uniref:MYND-type domain-containing protein n=1 Tax=Lepisosteus oculatus TaxID=7918 RepID=W5NC69_LEPOC
VMCCWVCEKSLGTVRRCGRCKKVYYCSQECQLKHWPLHKELCWNSKMLTEDVDCFVSHSAETQLTMPAPLSEQDNIMGLNMLDHAVTVKVKHNKSKHTMVISEGTNGEECFSLISSRLQIPQEKMRLISKGKVIHKDNILNFLKENALFQAFGEQAECEDGLDQRDIEVLMSQLSVERNIAVRALHKTGDLIDAIFYISDSM